jgi:hypothetical protein
MNQEQLELFEMIVDDAGMSIDYWAETAHHNTENQTYQITLLPDCVDETAGVVDKTVSYQDLLDATRKLATGEVSVNPATKSVCQAIISDPADVDYDATDTDVIVQVAMFGEIVFG